MNDPHERALSWLHSVVHFLMWLLFIGAALILLTGLFSQAPDADDAFWLAAVVGIAGVVALAVSLKVEGWQERRRKHRV